MALGNVQLQVPLHAATIGGEEEPEQSLHTSKMLGNAEAEVTSYRYRHVIITCPWQ